MTKRAAIIVTSIILINSLLIAKNPKPVTTIDFDGDFIAVTSDGQKVAPLQSDNAKLTDGMFGQSLDAQNGIVLRYPRKLLPVKAGSISMWICLSKPFDTNQWRFFFSDGTHWGPRGMPRFWIMESQTFRIDLDGGSRYAIIKFKPWPVGQWKHFVFTWDSQKGSTALYCNGHYLGGLKATAPWSAELTDSFRIGSGLRTGSGKGKNAPAYAKIDNVKIYDTKLSDSQIKELFSEGKLADLSLTCDTPVIESGKEVKISIFNNGYAKATGKICWKNESKNNSQPFSVKPQKTESITLSATDLKPGLNRISFEVKPQKGFAFSKTLSFYKQVNASSDKTDLTWKTIRKIDCTKIAPDGHIGPMKIVDSAIGKYLQAGDKINHRFAYKFKLTSPNKLVRITIKYPDDKNRIAGVSAWGPPQEALGSGYICGDTIPISGKMLERSFVYYSQPQYAAVVISTEASNQPAAIAEITIQEADKLQLPATTTPKIMAKNHRRIGLYWEDPIMARCFGIADSINPAEFELIADRLVNYCKWIGLDAVSYPAVWYRGPLYKSILPTAYPTGHRLHPSDFIETLSKKCGENDMKFYPSFNTWKLATLGDAICEEADVIAGKDCANSIQRSGKIVTWNTTRGLNDCLANPIHPATQKAIMDVVKEISDRCGKYKGFGGFDFMLWGSCIAKPGGKPNTNSEGSYDDYSVNQFAASIGQTPPASAPDPQRFKKYIKWINGNKERRQQWLKWRADRMTEFYQKVANGITSRDNQANLGIGIYYPHHGGEFENVDTGELIFAGAVDTKALAQIDNIKLRRFVHQLQLPWRLRRNKPRPENLNLPNSADHHKSLIGLPGVSIIFHQQYFETQVNPDNQIKLTGPYKTEFDAMHPNHGLRVTEPLYSGRNYLKYFAYAVKNFDADMLTVGGYVLGTQGVEDILREFVMAYKTLPAVQFKTIKETDDYVIRTADAEGKTWLYAQSVSSEPLNIKLPIKNKLLDTETGKQKISSKETLKLKPYQLKVFLVEK